jgi:hypothetical protein
MDRGDVSGLIASEMHDGRITADQAMTLLNPIPPDNERGEIHGWAMAYLRAHLGLQTHLKSGYPYKL